uniref:RRM domain-containing protein n=1 Tax=Ditylum brightwellii TaxID=49249 RepID=A0A7S2A4B9_9STRA|mmetsp:Transcript_8452/g.12633  ORF Transcript_8452/g.12633 Transcript_8452/m.12633 type:complete len:953 (+) Transcript_8452:62-2920(+)
MTAMSSAAAAATTTVFVRFNPPDTAVTRLHLQSYFSNVGPVKKCSVIRQKRRKKKRRQDYEDDDDEDDDDDDEKKSEREGKGYGFVKFTNEHDAKEAKQKLNNSTMKINGNAYKVFVELASDVTSGNTTAAVPDAPSAAKRRRTEQQQEETGEGAAAVNDEDEEALFLAKRKRTSRVILRNLSFYATQQNVKHIMEKTFGSVLDVELPLVPSSGDNKHKRPQHRGFAFVTFQEESSAKKAVDSGAGVVKIKKRPVAIDFSVSKIQHRRLEKEQKELQQQNEEEEKEEEEEKAEEDDGSSSSDDDGSDDDSNDEEKDDDDSSDDDSDDDDDDSSASSDTTASSSKSEEEDNEEEETPEKESPKIDPDIATQKTLFLRNVPFDATRHDLFELFRHYGEITGIYLVMDKMTGIGKGTAFVHFKTDASAKKVLADAYPNGQEDEDGVEKHGKNRRNATHEEEGEDGKNGGLYLNGRRIHINLAVDKSTASTFISNTSTEYDEDGNPITIKQGKDRRYLYLKNEGRVADQSGSGGDKKFSKSGNTWEDLPESDQSKRSKAHQEKHTKLRSPLFFVNPCRLSLRNVAKHVDEVELKKLIAKSVQVGLKENLVSVDDVIAYWRAGGTMSEREIATKVAMERNRKAREKSGQPKTQVEVTIIPAFNDKDVKRYIPSLYIDRDVEALAASSGASSLSGKNKAQMAPSKGFGFVEFTHHAHALACLRELNNNPKYSALYAAGGKKAMDMKDRNVVTGGKGGKRGKRHRKGEDDDAGDDGKVRIPRLIVEFTVENKAKARQQAERKAQQAANVEKQKLEKNERKKKAKAEKDDDKTNKNKKSKKGRGAAQREKKRKLREEGDDDENDNVDKSSAKDRSKNKTGTNDNNDDNKVTVTKKKGVKPPKKRKVDKEEEAFESMVRSYKETFAGSAGGGLSKKNTTDQSDATTKTKARNEIEKKRWYD